MTTPIDSLVVDLSNYDWDTFDARAFYEAGVRRAIVGSQQPSVCGPMVEALRDEGIEVIGSYDLPYFGSDETVRRPAERLAAFCSQYRIPLAWADAEIDANQTNVPEWQGIPTPSVEQRISEFTMFVDTVRKAVPVGVYTNASWWNPNMGGVTYWRDLPLWYADYGMNDGSKAPITSVNFGGWTKPLLHQYTSTHVINGRGRDMSYLFGEVAKEDELAQKDLDRIAALEERLARLQLAVFSGNEERDIDLTTRTRNVLYRIAQRVGDASDGTKGNSVADNAAAALKLVLARAEGADAATIKAIVDEALSTAAIVPGGKQ